jgi:hypothetical protein
VAVEADFLVVTGSRIKDNRMYEEEGRLGSKEERR